jgi:hypothetical protein
MTSSTRSKVVRLVHEDDGVLAIFDASSDTTTGILLAGTLGCHTCVGVYIPVAADRCYIAHINAMVREFSRTPRTGKPNPIMRRECSASEGERIRIVTLKQLEKTADRYDFLPPRTPWRTDHGVFEDVR